MAPSLFQITTGCLINRLAEISAKSRELLSGSPKIIFQFDYFSIVNNGRVTWQPEGFCVFFARGICLSYQDEGWTLLVSIVYFAID